MSDKPPAHQGKTPGGRVPVPPAEYRFKPGQSGNPRGRPAAGAVLKEWINAMTTWPLDKIRAVLKDPKARAAKIAAARVWIDACSEDRSAGGLPIAGGEFDRLCDRTTGRPAQEDLLARLEALEALLQAREVDARGSN
jgi:hypothetical protein